jgi:hypothetical protein
MNDGAGNNNTTASSNTSNRKSRSEETNCDDFILDQHQEEDDNDDDNDEYMSLNVPGAALIPQQVYQLLHSWRTNSSTFQSEDGTHTTFHHTSDDSDTPGRTPALPQLHLPGPMKNAVLQEGPTATFRHFVISCRTTHDDAGTAATSTSSSCPPPPSWIPPPMTLLRRSVSTPAPAAVHQHYNSLMMGDNDLSSIIPSPIPLDPFQRSTSTPSAFTDCCSTTSTKSSRGSSHNNNSSSAFSYALPVQQFLRADTNYQNEQRASSPQAVQFYSLARLEHTSIEVQQQQQQPATPSNNNNKRSARKFRSEARVLQRRRNNPPCTTTTTTSCASGNEVCVTIFVTGGDAEATSGTVIMPEGLLSGVVTAGTAAAVNEELCCLDMNLVGEGLEDTAVVGRAYYAPPGKHNSSPLLAAVRKPPMRSDRGRCVSPLTTTTTRASSTMRIRSLSRRRRSHSHSPPSSSTSPRPHVVSLSTAFSTLTTISETDREVMELNHGKTHNQLLRRQHQHHKTESLSDVSGRSASSQDSNSVLHHARGMTAAPPRHVASPREGATLPADRFFVDHRSTATTATRSSSAMSSAQSSSTNSDTGGSHSTQEESSPLPRFVSYATDGEEEDDDHSTRGNGLLEEQREESPSILDGSSSSSAASKTGVLYVPPRSSGRHWRMADTVAAAASAAAPELLLFGESVEVMQRTTPSKDLVKLGSAPAEEILL